MFPRLLTLLAIIATAASAPAQAVTGKAQTDLLAAMRAQYYNLRLLSVKSYTCNVDVDWDAIFKQFSGSALPADSPLMVYLTKSRLSVKETVANGAESTWANTGTLPKGQADTADQLHGAVKQLIGGFFEPWTQILNGDMFSRDVISATSTSTGYVITEHGKENNMDTLTFDKNLLLRHIAISSTDGKSENEMTFTKTSQGLLPTSIAGDVQHPLTAPEMHITMQTEYQTVDGIQIPAAIAIAVKGAATFNFKLSGCTVERQPK